MKSTNSEKLLFEISAPGKSGWAVGRLDVPEVPIEEIIPGSFLRSTPADLPQVSELDVVRHFTQLSQLNASIDTHFYPLGSCTMKYNPRVNEKAARMPGFPSLHPYAPLEDVQGILELLFGLQASLCEITGMDAFTLHPAAGAQGEFVGILAARAFHEANGQKRTRIIVPDTAHGTNPASAHLGGFEVVTLKSNERGRTSLDELEAVLDETVALFMLTNPNTLGLFEDDILQISRLVHEAGSLLYLDGANLNALVGIVRPGDLGFDIVHVNTHKTLSTPHGGGGPGAGPVGVIQKLAPFLPGAQVTRTEKGNYTLVNPERSIGSLRAFMGSVGVLIRAYSYLRALGPEGLRNQSRAAILNANYLLACLKDLLEPYVDEPCMHECVLSSKRWKSKGIRAMDIAKRLLDYGMHPPTTYFPLIVEEALMIEPTESESRDTLDVFVKAIRDILEEARNTPETVRTAPHSTPVGRLDEVKAAREPVLTWKAAVPSETPSQPCRATE